jgi:hypothetical protein
MQVAAKVDKQYTHSANANYWAPLSNYDDDDDDNIEIAQNVNIRNTSDSEMQHNLQTMILTWFNQRTDKSNHFVQKASTMVLDSGATLHFVSPEENVPIRGKLNKVVALPNGSTINAMHTMELLLNALISNARKAQVLPGMQPNSLVSVGKLADTGYTTVFHPAGRGVTVHQKKSLQIRLLHKPVLQEWRDAN